jgi:hypothetical protein
MNMAKANAKARFFIQRGKTEVEIKYKKEKINIEICIPTNREHDNLMEEFTEVTELGTTVRGAELVEERLIRNIINLPFEVPKTEDVNGDYVNWCDTTEDEKRCVVRVMDPKLRELINNKLAGEAELSEADVGNSE